MPRILVKFRKGYSRYNAGETAAFGEKEARKLCGGKEPVADAVGEVGSRDVNVPAIQISDAAVQAAATAARGEIEAKAEALMAREAGLDEREAELVEREKAVAAKERAAEGAAKVPADAAGNTDGGDKGAKASGEPPKQGGSK